MPRVWSDEEYNYVFNQVRELLFLYMHKSATIREAENVVLNLTLLNPDDLEYLAIAHFLLSNRVKEFIEEVPSILRRMSRSTRQTTVVNRGFVEGRIDWSQTIRHRCVQGSDPTLFVCSPASRIYNLPENQLLKLLLRRIKRLIDRIQVIPKLAETGIQPEEFLSQDGKETWIDRLQWINLCVNRHLKHVYMRHVELPKHVTPWMLRRARLARNKSYEKVEQGFLLQRDMIERSRMDILEELVKKRVLAPSSRDTLFELYVLFEIIGSLGEPSSGALVKPGGKAIASYEVGDWGLDLYYQRVRGLLRESKYKEIFEDYELGVSLRRPDIILHMRNQSTGEKKIYIIEVKRTINKGYIVDSVYKALGYVADFEANFPSDQTPKCVVVVWRIGRLRENDRVLTILSHNEVKDFINTRVQDLSKPSL